MVVLIILIIIILLIIIIIGSIVSKVTNTISNTGRILETVGHISKKFFGSDLIENVSPRSISTATKLYLPSIIKDFPTFNWTQWKMKINEELMTFIMQSEDAGGISIHATEIADYRKTGVTCTVYVQASVGYTSGGVRKEKCYFVDLVYAQDVDGSMDNGETGISLHCPNCGAPVRDLGTHICPYCRSVIREINDRIWKIISIREG